MFSVANICDTIARYYPVKMQPNDFDGAEAILYGLDVLQESYAGGSGSPIAAILQEILRSAISQYAGQLRMPAGFEQILATPQQSGRPAYTFENIMDACSRGDYFQQQWCVLEKYDVNLAQMWSQIGPRYGFMKPRGGLPDGEFRKQQTPSTSNEGEVRGPNYLMNIRNLLNE